MVYVQDRNKTPLMPTSRHGWVRRMLRANRAEVVRRAPFTIRLLDDVGSETQPVSLGIDSGYTTVGFSAVSPVAELLAGELTLLQGMSRRLEERAMYRTQRRHRLRFRKPGWMDEHKPVGWYAPSIRHKLDSHVRLVEFIKTLLPVTRVVVETGSFDPHKLKCPGVEGVGYQQGEQYGFDNLREYVLHRDGHKCRNPKCRNKAKSPILQAHHVGYWKGDRTDRPGNLVTLCNECHLPANHQKGGVLWGWEPKVPSLKAATFMSSIYREVARKIGAETTFGYITKGRRRDLGLDKSHATDAFVIAGGTELHVRAAVSFEAEQRRRNNRSLERFYDAKYRDARDGKHRSGQELSSGRRTRSREPHVVGENLRQHRAHKLSCGRRAIRRSRHALQPGDLVRFQGEIFTVRASHNKGTRVILHEAGKSVAVSKATLVSYGKGMSFKLTRNAIPPASNRCAV